ncbi:TRAP transporter substrate-binding protein [Orrella marina]|uniref:C4-dicarboxylate ABC transporter n=1 Tax=Orrella marina TaxID=2163011 RepID=A0A2R4XM40_9BURK|nr:TRAP transporter substrate-binding protein DctP [Orrella marina]AWB34866.1 hypothetical protein DBV39_15270 [Orrella marina]
MKKMKLTVLALSMLAASGAVLAKEKIRVADSLPVNHFIAEALIKPWMEEVKTMSNGDIVFQYFPAEQLAKEKDMFELVRSGGADVAYFVPSYTPEKFPLSVVGEIPGTNKTPCEATMAYWELTKEGGFLDEQELSKQGVSMLLPLSLAAYQIQTTKRPADSLKAFNGLQIRTAGDMKELALSKLGATPVSMTATEIRDAMARGTVDGSALSFSSVPPYGIEEVAKYSTDNFDLGTVALGYYFNRDKWNSFSDAHKKIMNDAAAKVVPLGCQMIIDLSNKDKQKMVDAGVEMVQFAESDQPKLNEILGSVQEEWAASVEKAGKPGKKALELYLEALQK